MATDTSEGGRSPAITKGYEQLLAEADANVKSYAVAEAADRFDRTDAVFVDVRDAPELQQEGKIPGAVHASRGMLEFHIDPESPYFIDDFGTDSEFIFYCALGGRSVLAAQRAQEMGLKNVSHMKGGFDEWKGRGEQLDEPSPSM